MRKRRIICSTAVRDNFVILVLLHHSGVTRAWADRPVWHHPESDTLMKVYFCGWIYKEHWSNDDLEGGEGGNGDDKIRWGRQLPHRVTPTLVTPLYYIL